MTDLFVGERVEVEWNTAAAVVVVRIEPRDEDEAVTLIELTTVEARELAQGIVAVVRS